MCRPALKIAGYKDESRPVHNEELGACAPDCVCGSHEDAEAELMLVSNTPRVIEIDACPHEHSPLTRACISTREALLRVPYPDSVIPPAQTQSVCTSAVSIRPLRDAQERTGRHATPNPDTLPLLTVLRLRAVLGTSNRSQYHASRFAFVECSSNSSAIASMLGFVLPNGASR